MSRLAALLLVVLAIFQAAPAHAHALRPGYLELVEKAPSTYAVSWRSPVDLGRPLPVEPRFPADCAREGPVARRADAAALISTWTIACEGDLTGRGVSFDGLEATVTDVLVRLQPAEGQGQAMRATPSHPATSFAKAPTAGGVAATYFRLGVSHIWSGVDHLLFVLALVLLINGIRRLVETITAFTVAHSITLVATTLGWISMPSRPVEAVIALSIVFLASELASRGPGPERLSERYPWIVAFIFGLLHGCGFAGALAEIGMPAGQIPMALFTFNLGVEAGQLAFVAVVLVCLALLRQLRLRKLTEPVATYAIGIVASAWLIERLV